MKRYRSQNIPLLLSEEALENTRIKEHGRGMLWFFVISMYVLGVQKMVLYMVNIPVLTKGIIYSITLVLILLYCVLEVWQEGEKRWLWIVQFVTALLLLVVIGLQTILQSGLYLINSVIGWWNITKSDGVPLFQTQGYTLSGITGCMLLLALVLMMLLWWAMESELLWLPRLVAFVFVIMALQVGRVSWVGISLVIVGRRGLNTLRIGRGNRLTKVFWFGLLLGLLLFVAHLEIQDFTVTKTAREKAKQGMEDLRYGENPLPEGNVWQAAEMNDGDEERLEVTSRVVKNLYLTGFTGADYENGQWMPLSKSAFGDSRSGILKWLNGQKFYVNHSYGRYNQVDENKKMLINQITIQNRGADREELFVPNSMIDLEGTSYREVRDSNVESKEWFGSKSYQIVENGEDIPGELMTVADWVKNPAKGTQADYIEAEQVYRSFVYENYTRMDRDAAAVIRKYFVKEATADDKTGIYSLTSYIRKVLAERVRFVWKPKSISDQADPISWFLQEGREGNSVLYASTAVEAFRAFGIPARYAEGYYVSKDAITQAKGNAVKLTDEDAHAWVQVYMDAIGWVDIDVTPGFYYDEYTLMQMVEQPQGMQLTAELQDEKQTGSHDIASGPQKPKTKNKHYVRRIVSKVMAGMVLLFGALVLVITVLELRRWIRYFTWNHKYRAAPREQYTILLEKEIIQRMHCLGIDAALGWQICETEQKLRKIVPSVYEGEYRFINGLMEKGIYGEEIPEYHELRAMLDFRDKLVFDARVKGKIWHRIYTRYRTR